MLLSLEAASLSCLLPLPSVLCSPESTSKSLSGNSAAFWAGTQPLLLAISPALGPYVLPPGARHRSSAWQPAWRTPPRTSRQHLGRAEALRERGSPRRPPCLSRPQEALSVLPAPPATPAASRTPGQAASLSSVPGPTASAPVRASRTILLPQMEARLHYSSILLPELSDFFDINIMQFLCLQVFQRVLFKDNSQVLGPAPIMAQPLLLDIHPPWILYSNHTWLAHLLAVSCPCTFKLLWVNCAFPGQKQSRDEGLEGDSPRPREWGAGCGGGEKRWVPGVVEEEPVSVTVNRMEKIIHGRQANDGKGGRRQTRPGSWLHCAVSISTAPATGKALPCSRETTGRAAQGTERNRTASRFKTDRTRLTLQQHGAWGADTLHSWKSACNF